MSNFEQRWEEAFEGIKEANNKKFGEFGGIMSLGFAEFKPLFELFYNQGKEDVVSQVENVSGNVSEDLGGFE